MPWWPPERPEPPDDIEDQEPGEWPGVEHHAGLTLHETENSVISTLYGPGGETLIELRERRQVPFGYQKPGGPR